MLAVLDAPDLSLHQVLGAAQYSLPTVPQSGDVEPAALRENTELIGRRGWRVDPENPALRGAATVLSTWWEQLGSDNAAAVLDGYADAVERIAAPCGRTLGSPGAGAPCR